MKVHRKIAICSDVHNPYEDPKALSMFLDFLKDEKPDEVILNGDICDFSALSLHGDADGSQRHMDEIESANELLDRIQSIHRGKCHYNEGNHEDRVRRYIAKNAPELEGLYGLENALNLKKRKISFLPYRAETPYFVTSKLAVTHGFAVGANAAKKTLERYGVSVIVGHTHTPAVAQLPVVSPTGVDSRKCWVLGCLAPTTGVPYMTAPTQWTQGWGMVYAMRSGAFAAYSIEIHNGLTVWNGKVYGG